MTNGPERPRRVVVVAIALLTLAHVVYYLPRVVDDLFISLRYADNLVHGRGLVYNVGERVEGFSSPLWVLLQALGLGLRVEGVLWTKLLGLASLGALHVGVHRLTRDVLGVRDPYSWVPNVVLALDSYVVAWALLGLETPLHLALIVWSFVLLRGVASASGRGRVVTVAVLVGMATVRPEGGAWALLAVACELIAGPFAELRRRGRALARVALPAAAIAIALLCARRVYYDDWVPNTYYAKAADAGFSLRKLSTAWASPAEAALSFGGLSLLLVAALSDRTRVGPFVIALSAVLFTSSVERDWMPSLRHLLPLLVVAPMGFAWLAARSRRRVLAFATSLAVLPGALVSARVDLRDMDNPQRTTLKRMEKLQDALLALRRVEPPHVTAMDPYRMGMVTQNYRVLEASAQPLDQSWYVGRDIGKLGYYTGVRVFDTAGLFTVDVIDDETWRRQRMPSPELVARALSKEPVAVEWFEWGWVASRDAAQLAPYRLVNGSPEVAVDLEARVAAPDPGEILRRYEQSLARFPRAFFLSTLHGESVGAAMARRTRIVRDLVGELHAMGPPPPDAVPNGPVLDEGSMKARGCTVAPPRVAPGGAVTVRCWFDVTRATRRPWMFFVHFLDAAGRLRFGADHAPVLVPSWRWRDGMPLRDFEKLTVPADVPPGIYRLRVGLYWGVTRARVEGEGSEHGDRLIGPSVEIVP